MPNIYLLFWHLFTLKTFKFFENDLLIELRTWRHVHPSKMMTRLFTDDVGEWNYPWIPERINQLSVRNIRLQWINHDPYRSYNSFQSCCIDLLQFYTLWGYTYTHSWVAIINSQENENEKYFVNDIQHGGYDVTRNLIKWGRDVTFRWIGYNKLQCVTLSILTWKETCILNLWR
jgi:hypothetical protein